MATEQQFNVTIRGVRPILLHSDRGLDPFDPLVVRLNEVTKGKDKNTEDNVREAEWIKYQLAFYGGATEAPWIPSDNILAALAGSGFEIKKTGKKDVLSGLDIAEDEVPITFDGPQTQREMFEHAANGDRPFVLKKSVRIPPRTGSRVPSSRPRIPSGWRMTFTLQRRSFCGLSSSEVERLVKAAGERVGLCDWRPRYGLFMVESFS